VPALPECKNCSLREVLVREKLHGGALRNSQACVAMTRSDWSNSRA
jgi:hypothetical protein